MSQQPKYDAFADFVETLDLDGGERKLDDHISCDTVHPLLIKAADELYQSGDTIVEHITPLEDQISACATQDVLAGAASSLVRLDSTDSDPMNPEFFVDLYDLEALVRFAIRYALYLLPRVKRQFDEGA